VGVNITYMTENGAVPGPSLNLPAHSRKTVNVADVVPNDWSVSTEVNSNQRVIAERSVYWSKDMAPPTPAPTPTPAPPVPPTPPSYVYDYTGSGNQATGLFGLQSGITTFKFTYASSEDSNFIVWLKDAQGNEVDLLTNEIVTNYSGGKLVSVPSAANYFMGVTSAGSWTIHVEQPRPATAPGVPQTYSGTTSGVPTAFTLNEGSATFHMTYQGDSNFIIWLYKSTGEQVELLENEIGNRDDTNAVHVDQGIYWLDITGMGSWSVTVSQ
jgi:hypothetical protein